MMDEQEMTLEECERVKKSVSKYGVKIVCDDEDEQKPDAVLPAGDGCETVQKVASKLGYQVVCEDTDE